MTNTPIISVTELATTIANGDKIVVADSRFDPFNPEAGAAAYTQSHSSSRIDYFILGHIVSPSC